MIQSWALLEEPSSTLVPRAFGPLVNNTSGKPSDTDLVATHGYTSLSRSGRNYRAVAMLTSINPSTVIAEVVAVSINLITAMHWGLTCFF